MKAILFLVILALAGSCSDAGSAGSFGDTDTNRVGAVLGALQGTHAVRVLDEPPADLRRIAQTSAAETLVNHLVRNLAPEGYAVSERPNEITRGSRAYSGILVQIARTTNPLQLVNPWAPSAAGSGEQNLAMDPITGTPSGLTLLAVQFRSP
ncbi:MAG: hypothetical protein RMN51_11575 [Verrucomicrobiota bacterium]|nr:hypothetical protein [Limisphaera sp.]MDW8382729.1 hypothetical protein [Verrucomicrobiota bacterium]